jgi:hypothetical protein
MDIDDEIYNHALNAKGFLSVNGKNMNSVCKALKLNNKVNTLAITGYKFGFNLTELAEILEENTTITELEISNNRFR